jgi:hypothetical protein
MSPFEQRRAGCSLVLGFLEAAAEQPAARSLETPPVSAEADVEDGVLADVRYS